MKCNKCLTCGETVSVYDVEELDYPIRYQVICIHCGTEGYWGVTKANAIEHWNNHRVNHNRSK